MAIISDEEFSRLPGSTRVISRPQKTTTAKGGAVGIDGGRDLGQKVAGGIEKIGEFFTPAIGTMTRTATLPTYTKSQEEMTKKYVRLGEKVAKKMQDTSISRERKQKILDTYKDAVPEIIMAHPDIEKTGTQILGEMAITAMTLGSPAIPIKVGKLGELASRTVASTAIGGAMGGAEALAEGENAKGVVKEAATGAALGALFAPAAYFAEKGLKSAGRSLYKTLVNYSSQKDKSAKALAARKAVGTLKGIRKTLNKDITVFENKLQGVLGESKARTTKKQIVDKAIGIKQKRDPTLARFLDADEYEKSLNSALAKIGDYKIGAKKPSMKETNQLRRHVDKSLGDRSFQKMFADLPEVKQNLSVLREALESITKTNVPASVPIFKEYAPAVTASKSISQTIRRVENRMSITFFEIMGLAGAAFRPEYLKPVMVGIVGRKLWLSGIAPSLGARTALEASSIINKAATDPRIQAMLFRTLAELDFPLEEDVIEEGESK